MKPASWHDKLLHFDIMSSRCSNFQNMWPDKASAWILYFRMCDEIQRVLGFDWLLLFIQGHVHSSSVILALRILLMMMQNPASMQKFKDGMSGGGWLKNTEPVLKQHVGVMLGE